MENELIKQQSREEGIDSVLNQTDKLFDHQPIIRHELKGLMLNMPDSIRRQFGCMYCEWRGTELCPPGFKKGKPKNEDERMPKWICPYRAAYLASFVKDAYPNSSSNFVNTTMWRKAILTTTMHQQQMRDLFKFEQLQTKIENLEEEIIGLKSKHADDSVMEKEHELNQLQKKIETARANWMSTTNGLMFYTSKDMDRETPKKLEIKTTTSMDLEQLDEIMQLGKNKLNKKENVIDGELVTK
jgi:hypothetical protein